MDKSTTGKQWYTCVPYHMLILPMYSLLEKNYFDITFLNTYYQRKPRNVSTYILNNSMPCLVILSGLVASSGAQVVLLCLQRNWGNTYWPLCLVCLYFLNMLETTDKEFPCSQPWQIVNSEDDCFVILTSCCSHFHGLSFFESILNMVCSK